ncbi:alpha/beta hydrolase [Deinococcus oregonensis]|uniref:Alpha/beta hydrolase n=1 Tax=Deinococcus oregonensis TaxID=1805970 RepID=A0ABV6B3G9_9DEIO
MVRFTRFHSAAALCLSVTLASLTLTACAPATTTAMTSAASGTAVASIPNAIDIPATGETRAALVIYPGANVAPEAYRWLGEALAGRGIRTVIVRFPLNLAVLEPNRAGRVIKALGLPAGRIFLAGHSLGGAMAAQFLAGQGAGQVAGLILMGAYPAGNVSLHGQPLLAVLDLAAQNDGLSTLPEVQSSLPRLPEKTRLVVLPGAVHADFGRYGEQKGDGLRVTAREVTEAAIIGEVAGFIEGVAR